ncbi:hypothetical protein [uncultured Tenacibaculum sp.]|uniref:hypothetical protein n=1 Tax=uncultured Tenacibaculum sp. TaxID=174713 RepID=UPI00260F00E7|nr:hypothetical protein [uncultured Tenacibaculum sp.]
MIKKISYTILIIGCILITVGYFRYNPTVVVNKVIPNTAEAVVRVNLRAIEYNVVTDIISHPFSYFNSKKSTSSSSTKVRKIALLDQVEIPADLFFYTNYQNLKGVWVSSAIKVKEKKTLIEFFEQEGFKEKTGQNFRYYESKNIVYVLLDDNLKVLIKLKKVENIEIKLAAVLNVKEYLTDEDLIIQKIRESKGLLALATKQDDFFEIKINKQVLNLTGVIGEVNNIFLPHQTRFKAGKMAHVTGKLKVGFISNLIEKSNKESFKKLTTLSLDSLSTSWNGGFELNLQGFKEEIDTIVTYEYDDDFNKVEKKSVQKKRNPNVSLYLNKTDAFYKYLTSKKAVKTIGSKKVFTMNPLFTTFINEDKLGVLLYFSKEPLKKVSNANDKFTLFFNVEKYNKVNRGIYNISNKYFRLIENIKANVTSQNDVTIEISLKNKSQNFMYQFLK